MNIQVNRNKICDREGKSKSMRFLFFHSSKKEIFFIFTWFIFHLAMEYRSVHKGTDNCLIVLEEEKKLVIMGTLLYKCRYSKMGSFQIYEN